MKHLFISAFCFSMLASIGYANEEHAKPAMRDAVTHEKLARILQYAQENDPMKVLETAHGEDPSKANQPADLLESSDIISYNGIATLVPKRAILSAPKNFKERLALRPNDQIVSWLDFLAANRGWISTVEVTRVQAEGNELLDKETQKHIQESTNLVVATFRQGPISVLPPKVPQDDSTATAKTAP